MSNTEICVPAGALAIAGEDGQSVAPGVGDEAMLEQVKGVVTRTEGGNVYLRITEANGQAIPGGDGSKEMGDGAGPESDDAFAARTGMGGGQDYV